MRDEFITACYSNLAKINGTLCPILNYTKENHSKLRYKFKNQVIIYNFTLTNEDDEIIDLQGSNIVFTVLIYTDEEEK